jgi:hypothetical protein
MIMHTIIADNINSANKQTNDIWQKDPDNYVRWYYRIVDDYLYPNSTPYGIEWSSEKPFSDEDMIAYFEL